MGIDVLPDGSGSHHTGYNEQLGNGAGHHTVGCSANRNQGRPSHGVESANGNQDKSSYGVESASGNRGASPYGGGWGKRNPRHVIIRRRKCKPEPGRVIIRGWMGQTESEADRHPAEDGTTDFRASLYDGGRENKYFDLVREFMLNLHNLYKNIKGNKDEE